jgi:hypothetical protein
VQSTKSSRAAWRARRLLIFAPFAARSEENSSEGSSAPAYSGRSIDSWLAHPRRPMRRDDARVLAVAAAIVGLVDALAGERATGAGDELVPFPFGLERRAARALVHSERLPVVRLGRRIFTRRSALVALVEASPPARSPAVADPAVAARAAYIRGAGLRIVRGTRR